ncbi:hypothetical protein N7519_007096 [Penicillium mononematosum]|uniref:uncharacterized protein n=1 Tax=Penicillium mononematosum TaxID=268346 RepID=UPI002547C4C4|nr:uncharacterized protein N7519_007096 [Penicillium mononematosum]KAJ6185795.1 hypothetical protein N7519_007096 [Penicillium mononematosum]
MADDGFPSGKSSLQCCFPSTTRQHVLSTKPKQLKPETMKLSRRLSHFFRKYWLSGQLHVPLSSESLGDFHTQSQDQWPDRLLMNQKFPD